MNRETAVIVCAGPSLDALPPRVWERVADAGAVVAVNGALAAEACNGVDWTYASAMDARQLSSTVPRFHALWTSTAAWRLSMRGAEEMPAETYIREVDERDGIEGWSDDPGEGYAGGSSAMVTANWLCNAWWDGPSPGASRHPLPASRGEGYSKSSVLLPACGEKVPEGRMRGCPPRAFRRIAFLGLDMLPGQGGHARGAGDHTSGFALSAERHAAVSGGWAKVCREAARRGIEIVNLTPGTGLRTMPAEALP
jgi:hypothetical protein